MARVNSGLQIVAHDKDAIIRNVVGFPGERIILRSGKARKAFGEVIRYRQTLIVQKDSSVGETNRLTWQSQHSLDVREMRPCHFLLSTILKLVNKLGRNQIR